MPLLWSLALEEPFPVRGPPATVRGACRAHAPGDAPHLAAGVPCPGATPPGQAHPSVYLATCGLSLGNTALVSPRAGGHGVASASPAVPPGVGSFATLPLLARASTRSMVSHLLLLLPTRAVRGCCLSLARRRCSRSLPRRLPAASVFVRLCCASAAQSPLVRCPACYSAICLPLLPLARICRGLATSLPVLSLRSHHLAATIPCGLVPPCSARWPPPLTVTAATSPRAVPLAGTFVWVICVLTILPSSSCGRAVVFRMLVGSATHTPSCSKFPVWAGTHQLVPPHPWPPLRCFGVLSYLAVTPCRTTPGPATVALPGTMLADAMLAPAMPPARTTTPTHCVRVPCMLFLRHPIGCLTTRTMHSRT